MAKDMTEIFEGELRKLRDYPRFVFHSFVYLSEYDEAKKRLMLSGVRHRTVKVYENGVFIGYNIYVEG